MTTTTHSNNHKPQPLQVEFRHPDQPDLPLDVSLQQPLADAIFTDPLYPVSTELSTTQAQAEKLSADHDISDDQTQPPHPNQNSDNQTTETEQLSEASTEATTTVTTMTTMTETTTELVTAEAQTEKLSHGMTSMSTGTEKVSPGTLTPETEKVSQATTSATDVDGLVTPPKRKRGRPRKVKNPIPVLPDVDTASKYLNKSSVFYLRLYSNLLTLEQVRARLSDPCKKTVAEQFALELLISAGNKKERDLNRYWNIISKPDKATENAPKTPKNSTILDDILTSVEAEVFGDIPEADTMPTPDEQKS